MIESSSPGRAQALAGQAARESVASGTEKLQEDNLHSARQQARRLLEEGECLHDEERLLLRRGHQLQILSSSPSSGTSGPVTPRFPSSRGDTTLAEHLALDREPSAFMTGTLRATTETQLWLPTTWEAPPRLRPLGPSPLPSRDAFSLSGAPRELTSTCTPRLGMERARSVSLSAGLATNGSGDADCEIPYLAAEDDVEVGDCWDEGKENQRMTPSPHDPGRAPVATPSTVSGGTRISVGYEGPGTGGGPTPLSRASESSESADRAFEPGGSAACSNTASIAQRLQLNARRRIRSQRHEAFRYLGTGLSDGEGEDFSSDDEGEGTRHRKRCRTADGATGPILTRGEEWLTSGIGYHPSSHPAAANATGQPGNMGVPLQEATSGGPALSMAGAAPSGPPRLTAASLTPPASPGMRSQPDSGKGYHDGRTGPESPTSTPTQHADLLASPAAGSAGFFDAAGVADLSPSWHQLLMHLSPHAEAILDASPAAMPLQPVMLPQALPLGLPSASESRRPPPPRFDSQAAPLDAPTAEAMQRAARETARAAAAAVPRPLSPSANGRCVPADGLCDFVEMSPKQESAS